MHSTICILINRTYHIHMGAIQFDRLTSLLYMLLENMVVTSQKNSFIGSLFFRQSLVNCWLDAAVEDDDLGVLFETTSFSSPSSRVKSILFFLNESALAVTGIIFYFGIPCLLSLFCYASLSPSSTTIDSLFLFVGGFFNKISSSSYIGSMKSV